MSTQGVNMAPLVFLADRSLSNQSIGYSPVFHGTWCEAVFPLTLQSLHIFFPLWMSVFN